MTFIHNAIKSIKATRNIVVATFNTSKRSLCEKKLDKFSINESAGTQRKKKIATTPKITLIDINNTRKTIYLEEAEKLAKHSNLQLIEENPIGNKPTFRLVKVGTSIKSSESFEKKKSKFLVIKSSIFKNDLEHKINQIIKSLDNGVEVIVDILKVKNPEEMENVAKTVVNAVESKHKVQKKVPHGTTYKLHFTPILTESSSKNN